MRNYEKLELANLTWVKLIQICCFSAKH